MKKQNLIIIVVAGLILLSGSFYGGMQYESKLSGKSQSIQNGKGDKSDKQANTQRMPGEQNNQRGMGGGQGATTVNNGRADNFFGGEMIAKDETSMTLKTRDGSSKVIFFSDKTTVDKSISGSITDLGVGQQITISGQASADGSVVAQNIQIRPAGDIK